MCGIAGIADQTPNTEVNRRHLTHMLDLIEHRGPDDQGVHIDNGLLLGMRRLSIIDVAGGHQPIANEDQTIWVVCNGEIYNFRELRRSLEAQGHRFATSSDTEVLVHAYEQHGEEFLNHIEGMFGLALWDAKRRRLIIARDRLGIKPLYYSSQGGRLAFGSELKSLLCLPWISSNVSSAGLAEYLSLGYAGAPHTLLEDVFKLPPGCFLSWQEGDLQVKRYWRLTQPIDDRLTESQWVERIRSELERAVHSHMVSDVPVGAFLSGGIDSSAIVGLMGRADSNPINTFAIGYAGSDVAEYYNELPFARQVAQRYQTNHKEIQVSPDVATLLPKLIWHVEEPICDTATLTTYLVSQLAAESVKVIVSGVGGDEVFAGYTRYLGDVYARRYEKVPKWLRGKLLEPLIAKLPSGRSNKALDLARYAKEFVRTSGLAWDQQYHSFLELQRPEVLEALLGESARAIAFSQTADLADSPDYLVRLLQTDSQLQLAESLLLLSDKITMATSIECRVPFLDHRLVELGAQIPAHLKLPGRNLKGLLKSALRDILPMDVLQRSKRGFGAPFGSWVQNELKPLRSELLSAQRIRARGLLCPDTVQKVLHAHDQNREDYTDLLMVLMNLELWHCVFVDQQSPDDVAGDLTDRLRAAA